MAKFYFYRNCEIKYNFRNDEYSAFNEDGEEGGTYLGGGFGVEGKNIAEKVINEYWQWKNSFINAVNERLTY